MCYFFYKEGISSHISLHTDTVHKGKERIHGLFSGLPILLFLFLFLEEARVSLYRVAVLELYM